MSPVIHVCARCNQPFEPRDGHDCPRAGRRRPKPTSAADKIRATARWQRTRARILRRDGHRCTFGTYDDERYWLGRCPVTKGVDVHHRQPIEQGGAPFAGDNLRTMCATHHARDEQRIREAAR